MTGGGSGLTRRRLLAAVASASAAAVAGCSATESEPNATTTAVPTDEARTLAERYAPVLYFDANERWFPTDPRLYESESDGEPVVEGFDAFNGYSERATETPVPDPTVFYNVRSYEASPLTVVQYWFYSAFDQFTTNFHWHDWEVVHVFIDTERDSARLHVASSHSRRVPNNEHLDPMEEVPRILSELGSHSSALSLNEERESFQRVSVGDISADITNRAIRGLSSLKNVPAAYGLPRDEGFRLPFVVPELDGKPVYEHERLPAVTRETLVPEALTIRSFDDLTSPPTDLPGRETGLALDFEGRNDPEGDETYTLVPATEVEHLTAFTGTQLSFEFNVPQFAEDAIAGHLTTTDAPWTQERYEDPAADITEPAHRAALAEQYDAIGAPGSVGSVVAAVTEAVTTDDAPENEGLTTQTSNVEAVALLESDPEAVPTFSGVALLRDVPPGEHRLTVNRAGAAPYSQQLNVSDATESETATNNATETEATDGTADTTETETADSTADATTGETGGSNESDRTPPGVAVAGVDGEIPLVASGDAVKLRVDADGTDATLTDVAVEDDFAGRLYDSPVDGSDAVYVHRGGAYTTEVRDTDDAIGAFRVNPAEESSVTIDRPRTGKASLASFLADVTRETATTVQEAVKRTDADGDKNENGGDDSGTGGGPSANAIHGLTKSLEAIAAAADRAAERAESNDAPGADKALEAATDNLQRAKDRLEAASDDLPNPAANAARNRLDQATRRSEQALAAEKL
ncbi:hypothetical protein G3I44_06815 [Halogeometricum borinquense]|uniref:Uncharacterized protein n=1 Tax=Halogeometricum borinquense TaxID=60847 RepID=A0A6C0UHH0_9EURY|nr:hypothetical protein [Halogeometricum borinquense]QIB74033.1 hypothetical protein G3I44_06815 [Halogeometricum borinquense]